MQKFYLRKLLAKKKNDKIENFPIFMNSYILHFF